MRYALIIIAFLFCTIKTEAQVYQAMPQAGYGPVKRMLIDSVLTIPIGISQLRNITGGRDTAQIRYQKSDSSVYVYTGSTWVKLGTGGGGGGSADSTVFFTVYRADTMRANIYASIVSTDSSVFFTKYRSDTMRTNLYSYIKNVDSVTYFTKYRSDTMRANIYAAIPQPDTFYVKYPVRVNNDTIYLAQTFVDSVYSGGGGNFVPYTGATADVDLGANKLSAASIYVEGTNGNGHIHLKHQNADATATGQSTSLFANSEGDLKWKNNGSYYTTLKTSTQTANRVYSFPDSTGTVALLSNLSLKANIASPTFTGSVGIGGSPAASAVLEVSSTTQGILIPRMTSTQRNAISTPASQLIVANTTDKTIDMYNGTSWNTIGGGYTDEIAALQLMGATIKTAPIGQPVLPVTASAMVSARSYFSAIYLNREATITGASWYQSTQGVYVGTGAGYNGIALYRDSSGTLLLVDSTTRDTTIWKATTNTWNQKAFAGGSRTLQPGVYYLMALVNTVSGTFPTGQTAPVIGNWSTPSGNNGTFTLISNSRKIMGGVQTSVSTPPTSQAMTAWNNLANFYYSLYLY